MVARAARTVAAPRGTVNPGRSATRPRNPRAPEHGLASGHPILRLIPLTYPPPNEGVCHA